MPGNELIESLVSDYRDYGTDGVIVVTRSNKRANVYNNGIRARIFDREEALTRGDLVMAVKNNYYWTERAAKRLPEKEELPFSFIANGDTAEVMSIRNVHEQYGFSFADATLRFPTTTIANSTAVCSFQPCSRNRLRSRQPNEPHFTNG